jgi:hypothetical protein
MGTGDAPGITSDGPPPRRRPAWHWWVFVPGVVLIAAACCYPFGEWPRPVQARQRALRLAETCPWFAIPGARWDQVHNAYLSHFSTPFRSFVGGRTEGSAEQAAREQEARLRGAGWEITQRGPAEFGAILRDHAPSGKPVRDGGWTINYVLAWRGQRLAVAVEWGTRGNVQFRAEEFWARWPRVRERMLRGP